MNIFINKVARLFSPSDLVQIRSPFLYEQGFEPKRTRGGQPSNSCKLGRLCCWKSQSGLPSSQNWEVEHPKFLPTANLKTKSGSLLIEES